MPIRSLGENFRASKKPSGVSTLEGSLGTTLRWRQSTRTLRVVWVDSPLALEIRLQSLACQQVGMIAVGAHGTSPGAGRRPDNRAMAGLLWSVFMSIRIR